MNGPSYNVICSCHVYDRVSKSNKYNRCMKNIKLRILKLKPK